MSFVPFKPVFVVLASICVFLIFLIPSGLGPFAVTHGPVTAFRSWIFAILVLLAIRTLRIVRISVGRADWCAEYALDFLTPISPRLPMRC